MLKAVVSRDSEAPETGIPAFYHVALYESGVHCGTLHTPAHVAGPFVGALRVGGIDVVDLTDTPEEEEPDVV